MMKTIFSLSMVAIIAALIQLANHPSAAVVVIPADNPPANQDKGGSPGGNHQPSSESRFVLSARSLPEGTQKQPIHTELIDNRIFTENIDTLSLSSADIQHIRRNINQQIKTLTTAREIKTVHSLLSGKDYDTYLKKIDQKIAYLETIELKLNTL